MKFEPHLLGDVIINYDSSRIPLSSQQREIRKGPYRYYGAQGIIDYIDDFIFDGTYLLVAEDGENLLSKKQPIAQIASGRFWVNNHAHILRNNVKSDLRYIYYLLNSIDISAFITGSAQPKLSQTSLNAIPINLPSLNEQSKIANILSALDDKIETNTKINHHLEQMAQAIFKSWFIDFEPWGGVMPEAWREGVLSDICDYNVERTSVASLTCDTYISTENMLPNKGGFVPAANLPTIAQTTAFRNGDTLISNIRPYFKKIIYCNFNGGCSTDVLCFHPRKPRLSLFLYNILHFDRFFDYMVAGSKGTKMPRGDKQQIMNYLITIPTENILDDFINAISPISIQQAALADENKYLASLRDTLLPRLMSGDLSVADL